VKTSSGATALQIVHSFHRGSRDIGYIGSAHDDAGRAAADHFLSDGLSADALSRGTPVGKAACFKDSEGNVLTITQLDYGH
jgi:hypothetical protein